MFSYLVVCCFLGQLVNGGSFKSRFPNVQCDQASFQCTSGECIAEDNLCDGVVHCKDGSDETRDCVNIIPCSSNFVFQCDYGACINKTQQCDGKFDCKDNSDESEDACKICGEAQFRCISGQLIDDTLVCDGTADCGDESDESPDTCKSIICPIYSFTCAYGACINSRLQCNGLADCLDGSDEERCPRPILGHQDFACASGQCIPKELVCDGVPNCKDGSDEVVEVCENFKCPRFSYRCSYGACVKRSSRCDGVINCRDESDEKDCASTLSYEPTITPTGRCAKYEFTCHSGQCINENKMCNGHKDCADGSEETFDLCAYRRCPSTKYTCDYGGCVPANAQCDGVSDCWDGSDESYCDRVPNSTPLPFNDWSTSSDWGTPAPSEDKDAGCVIPRNPDHGQHLVTKANTGSIAYTRGIAPNFSVLVTKCAEGYAPTPPKEWTFSLCLSKAWSPSPVNCAKTCPTLISTSHTECKFQNVVQKSCDNAVHGTVAITPCADLSKNLVQVCRNGAWDLPLDQCLPSGGNGNGTVINIFYIFKDKSK